MDYGPREILELLGEESSVEPVVRYLRSHKKLWHRFSPFSAEFEFIGMLDFDRSRISNSREVPLLEVFWQLKGASQFLHEEARHLAHTKFVELFLASKLNDPATEFTLDDLHLISRITPGLSQITSKRIAQGFMKHVSKMEWAPPDFDQDVRRVTEFVAAYNFPILLSDCLLEVERGLEADVSAFDYKSALTHLRTFFEHLHRHVATTLQKHDPSTIDNTNLVAVVRHLNFYSERI